MTVTRLFLLILFFSSNSYAVVHISNCPKDVGASIKQSLEALTTELPRVFNDEFSYRDIIVEDEIGNGFVREVNFSLEFSNEQILDIYDALNNRYLNISCQEKDDFYCPYGMNAYTPHLKVRNKIVFCERGYLSSSYCKLSTTLFHEIAHVANIPEVPEHTQSSQENYSPDDKIYLFGDAVNNLCNQEI